jgi:hypothetical protein
MPASSAPPAQLSAEQPAGPPPVGQQPFLRFYHSAGLRTKTLAMLATVEQAPDPTRHRNALSDMVMELTDSGLEYYFLRPLDVAKANFVIKQSAHLGMGGVMRVIGPVVHNIIGRMDKQQLLVVCQHIRQLME